MCAQQALIRHQVGFVTRIGARGSGRWYLENSGTYCRIRLTHLIPSLGTSTHIR